MLFTYFQMLAWLGKLFEEFEIYCFACTSSAEIRTLRLHGSINQPSFIRRGRKTNGVAMFKFVDPCTVKMYMVTQLWSILGRWLEQVCFWQNKVFKLNKFNGWLFLNRSHQHDGIHYTFQRCLLTLRRISSHAGQDQQSSQFATNLIRGAKRFWNLMDGMSGELVGQCFIYISLRIFTIRKTTSHRWFYVVSK